MNSNTVFRFVSMRGVQRSAPSRMSVLRYSFGTSPLSQLAKDLGSGASKEAIERLCREYFESDKFINSPASLPYFRELMLEQTVGSARAKFLDEQGASVEDFVSSDEFREFYDRLWDSYFAVTAMAEKVSFPVGPIVDVLRQLEYLVFLRDADESNQNITDTELSGSRLILPDFFIPAEPEGFSKYTDSYVSAIESSKELVTAAAQRVSRDIMAISHLRKLDDDLRFTETSEPVETTIEAPDDESGGMVAVEVDWPLPWVMNDDLLNQFPPDVQAMLAESRHMASNLLVPEYLSLLEDRTRIRAAEALESVPKLVADEVLNTKEFATLAEAAGPAAFNGAFSDHLYTVVEESLPNGVRSLGVGDLILVRERLRKYDLGEVAHIQNILQSESLKRTHSRLREVEETFTVETETTEEEAHSLQSTERFEMQREVQKSIEARDDRSAGVTVSASYGPVSMTARTEISSSKSQSESAKSARQYAREVTEESLQRVSTRVRQERVRRTLQRFEEVNEHGFDNSQGPTNITGVYRWVNKVYNNYLINYGRRLILEFIIPEPAAFFLEASKSQSRPGVSIQKPPEPTIHGRRLRASDLERWNYQYYTSLYGLSEVETYPQEGVRLGISVVAGSGEKSNKNLPYAQSSNDFSMPDGYVARGWTLSWSWSGVGDKFWANWKVAGRAAGEASLAGITGTVPISVVGWGMRAQMNLMVSASPTPQKVREWQDKVFSQIMAAYEQRLAIYNEEVSARSIGDGIQFGRRPDENRLVETSELRKGAIRLLSNGFDRIVIGDLARTNEKFDSMSNDLGSGFPEFAIAEAAVEGKISQFFEQAFEWSNMTYSFYPYFWARKEKWVEIQGRYDADPKFTEFLRSGAARLVVPVHPAYQAAVLHYFATKEVWLGEEPPVLDDDLYKSIVEDLKGTTDYNPPEELPLCTDGGQTPCVLDMWEVTLPTSLVYLQENADLPEFDLPVVENDIEKILDAKVEDLGQDLNWRSSVVDLLKTLEQESDLASRRALAKKLGYQGGSGSSEMNIWLHGKIMQILIRTGGEWPEEF